MTNRFNKRIHGISAAFAASAVCFALIASCGGTSSGTGETSDGVAPGQSSSNASASSVTTSASQPSTNGSPPSESPPADSSTPAGAPSANVIESVRNAFPDEILERGTLRVGVIAPSPPQTIVEDGKLSGIDIEIQRAIGEIAGLEAEFTTLPFTSIITALQSGQIDTTGSLVPSPDRTAAANFVIAYRVPFGILLPKDNPKNVESSNDLCGLTVAAVQGSAPPHNLIEARKPQCEDANKPIKVIDYSDQSSALLALQTGKADAFIQGYSLTQYIAQTTDDGDTFTSVPDYVGIGGSVYFADAYGVTKDDQQLTDAMQGALKVLLENGTLKSILAKYGIPDAVVSEITINELSEADQYHG